MVLIVKADNYTLPLWAVIFRCTRKADAYAGTWKLMKLSAMTA
ncbi:hypothetical protein XIS1_850008 [Xenorhabdus innexi]|uniref:Uncharacterized protein n=1 Tax=Xenorhabdus innexi TaxID=290109 RepID=A0A1N6N1A4_9GAMM|nr:hypothetical protein XIS1_850008 [Xenorhabdus innexi]